MFLLQVAEQRLRSLLTAINSLLGENVYSPLAWN